jgi:hypothetical protein
VRFTTSEETGNPNSDFIGRCADRSFIAIEKGAEVLTKFLCDNVLAKLLLNALLIILCHFDDTIDRSVNV